MTDTKAADYAKVFRAASKGVWDGFHGKNQAIHYNRDYHDPFLDQARMLSGAFDAIADVFEATAKAEETSQSKDESPHE